MQESMVAASASCPGGNDRKSIQHIFTIVCTVLQHQKHHDYVLAISVPTIMNVRIDTGIVASSHQSSGE